MDGLIAQPDGFPNALRQTILTGTAFLIGIAVFFLLVPFALSPTTGEFAQWLEGLAGPLGFVSICLIAYTTMLQQEQYRQVETSEQAVTCERLLESYSRLADVAEIISNQQHAAPPSYRRGRAAFALLASEYDRRVTTLFRSTARQEEHDRFCARYASGVEPFVRLMVEIQNSTVMLPESKRAALQQRIRALSTPDERRMLVLFERHLTPASQGGSAQLAEWLRV